jgi:hypothetical protein
MAYYIQMTTDGKLYGVWEVQTARARRIGVASGEDVEIGAAQDIWEAIREKFPRFFQNYSFERMELAPGEYFPRTFGPTSK